MRNFILAANWKMHKTPVEAAAFFRELVPKLEEKPMLGANGGARRVVFFVPALDISASALELSNLGAIGTDAKRKNANIELGGQNIHHEVKGAFTGENSAAVLKSMGVGWALVGHSERRTLFAETDSMTAQKMKTAIANDLSAMLCVGETLAEREAGATLKIVERQLQAGLAEVLETIRKNPSKISIAYEPVWAIGTGKVASPEQASEVHQMIRGWLATKFDATVAADIAILYGGSVKPDNAQALGQMKDIDGFLVGGAALEPATFLGLF